MTMSLSLLWAAIIAVLSIPGRPLAAQMQVASGTSQRPSQGLVASVTPSAVAQLLVGCTGSAAGTSCQQRVDPQASGLRMSQAQLASAALSCNELHFGSAAATSHNVKSCSPASGTPYYLTSPGWSSEASSGLYLGSMRRVASTQWQQALSAAAPSDFFHGEVPTPSDPLSWSGSDRKSQLVIGQGLRRDERDSLQRDLLGDRFSRDFHPTTTPPLGKPGEVQIFGDNGILFGAKNYAINDATIMRLGFGYGRSRYDCDTVHTVGVSISFSIGARDCSHLLNDAPYHINPD